MGQILKYFFGGKLQRNFQFYPALYKLLKTLEARLDCDKEALERLSRA